MASSRHGIDSDRHRVRPTSSRRDKLDRPSKPEFPPQSVLGQFSFGPTTQTTVVTTTTTTTTNFPPFLMQGPSHATDLDPRQYPLAASPTPMALQNISFSLEGRPVVFKEIDDTSFALEQVEYQQNSLRRGDGVIQSIQSSEKQPFIKTEDQPSPSAQLLQTLNDRPASPESITESEHYLQTQDNSPARSTRSHRSGKQVLWTSHSRKSHPRLREVRSSNPITPQLSGRPSRSQRHSDQSAITPGNSNLGILPSPDTEQQHNFNTRRDGSPLIQQQSFEDEMLPVSHRRRTSRTITSRASHDSIVPTPPIEPHESASERRLTTRALSSIPARLHVSESPSLQDGTLPSPSLSPVTAAASGIHGGYFTDMDSASEMPSPPIGPYETLEDRLDRTPSRSGYDSPAATETDFSEKGNWISNGRHQPTSTADIPSVINFFEALPDELKSYVMHQLLRRCSKSTLHVIADAVNPALKCDFLTILPLELALNILSYLDVRSLCRASQVSRKWRQMINSDERAWKELFDADGFTLPEGELQRAISQGWGWQDPYEPDGREYDMGTSLGNKSDSEAGSPRPSIPIIRRPVSATLRRSKRKAATQLTNRNKMIKRQYTSRETSIDLDNIDWIAQMSTAEGPYNAANAAILAIPHPKLPIPSLKGLHLYKSLYRRHHQIRNNWMSKDTKPYHLAFRAHDSHVVTCLQFDTDKILTGSDDNNINVYDTRTGRLRRLLRGHEGGVWALQYVGNTLVSGSTDRSVRVWNIENGEETHVFRGHTSTVRCLQIVQPVKVGETAEGKDIMMPKQPLIITGSRDSTLRIWKLPRSTDPSYIQSESDAEAADDNPYFVRTLSGHQHSVRAIAAHADTLVSGSYDCHVRVWKISTGETVHRLQGHGQKVYSVVLDHERNRCISGSMDYLVKIWSLDTGSALYTLEGHSSLVGLLDLNNNRLVSAAADATLRIWDPENGQCKTTLSAHHGAITCFQHDGQKVISGSDRTLKMWDIKTGECMKDLLSDLSGVWQVKFNERRCVAAVQRDNMTFIEVLDFGAARDGVEEKDRGRRIVVDEHGRRIKANDDDSSLLDA